MSSRRVFCVIVALLALSAPLARAEVFKVDATHSGVIFKIKHLNAGVVFGRFNNILGEIDYNESDPSKSTFNISVAVASIDTGNQKRDDHLKSPDFFSANEFKSINFKSKSIKVVGDKWEVTGDLTLHGVKKEITVTMDKTGPVETKAGRTFAIETTFTIKRSEYGMKKMLDAAGDDVTLIIGIEG